MPEPLRYQSEGPLAVGPALRRPMPQRDVHGPGRDRSFALPQYYVEVAGVKLAIADAGSGPALLFIHGLAGNLTHWLHVAPQLREHYRVVCVDLPGCGNSARLAEGYTVAGYAEQLRGLLTKLDIDQATVIGHSLGGMVAAEFGLKYPEATAGLVLVNPAGFQRFPWVIQLTSRLLLREALLNRVLPRVWKGLLGLVFRTRNAYTEQFIRSVEETHDPADIFDLTRVMSSLRPDFVERDHLDRLDALTMPVQLLWGSDDLLVPAKSLRSLADKLKRARAEEIPGCGHMPLIERPERVRSAILELLDM